MTHKFQQLFSKSYMANFPSQLVQEQTNVAKHFKLNKRKKNYDVNAN